MAGYFKQRRLFAVLLYAGRARERTIATAVPNLIIQVELETGYSGAI